MKKNVTLAILISLFSLTGKSYGQFIIGEDRVSAPIVYEDLMLVIVDGGGAAAVVFPQTINNGVKYRFRYESKDGKKNTAGSGNVFEKGPESQTTIQAGPISMEWSMKKDDAGWIYYVPERMKVFIVNAEQFEDSVSDLTKKPIKKLDLKRFMNK